MLKRFMNWLLHRLQKLLGVLSGKHRGQSRSGVASQSPFVLERQPNQPTPFDTARALSADLDDSLSDSTSSKELGSSSQPFNSQQSNDAVAADILDPMLAEPDTHRRLNASSAAMPGATPQVPSFPTEVSELISSAPAQSVTSSAEPEQLPAIHDLLPAIEPDESEETPAPPVPQAILCSFDITESDVSPIPQDSDSTVEPLSASEATSADSLPEAKREPVPLSLTSVTSESSLSIPEVASPTIEEAMTDEEAMTEEPSSGSAEDLPVAAASDEPLSEEQELDREMEQQSLFVEEEEEEITLEIELEDPTAVTAPLSDEPSAADLLPAVEDEPLELLQDEPQAAAGIVTAQVAGLSFPVSDSDDDVPGADASDETLSVEQDPDQTIAQQSFSAEEEEEIAIEIELEDSTAVADLMPSLVDEPLASDLLPAVANGPLEPAQEKPKDADIVAAQVSGLPYPWSLAASNKATQANAEVTSDSSAAVRNQGLSENTDEPLLESEVDRSTSASLASTEAQSEVSSSVNETSFKNGVVKLLFTLKPGNFHGYIAPDDGTQDILFHQKYINADAFEQLSRGAKVVVTVKYIEGKAYAKQVDLV